MKLHTVSLQRAFPYLLTVGGIAGLLASLELSYDTLQVSKNAHYIPSCNLNPILSCGNVINAAGDKILGQPYPYYGIVVFAILIVIGISLLAGATYKKWQWFIFQVMFSLGTIGAYLLLLKSVFRIHALCPYCLSVDVVVTTLFWYLTLYNFDNKTMKIKRPKVQTIYHWIRRHHLDLLILWFIVVTGFIIKHFWYYYGKHL